MDDDFYDFAPARRGRAQPPADVLYSPVEASIAPFMKHVTRLARNGEFDEVEFAIQRLLAALRSDELAATTILSPTCPSALAFMMLDNGLLPAAHTSSAGSNLLTLAVAGRKMDLCLRLRREAGLVVQQKAVAEAVARAPEFVDELLREGVISVEDNGEQLMAAACRFGREGLIRRIHAQGVAVQWRAFLSKHPFRVRSLRVALELCPEAAEEVLAEDGRNLLTAFVEKCFEAGDEEENEKDAALDALLARGVPFQSHVVDWMLRRELGCSKSRVVRLASRATRANFPPSALPPGVARGEDYCRFVVSEMLFPHLWPSLRGLLSADVAHGLLLLALKYNRAAAVEVLRHHPWQEGRDLERVATACARERESEGALRLLLRGAGRETKEAFLKAYLSTVPRVEGSLSPEAAVLMGSPRHDFTLKEIVFCFAHALSVPGAARAIVPREARHVPTLLDVIGARRSVSSVEMHLAHGVQLSFVAADFPRMLPGGSQREERMAAAALRVIGGVEAEDDGERRWPVEARRLLAQPEAFRRNRVPEHVWRYVVLPIILRMELDPRGKIWQARG